MKITSSENANRNFNFITVVIIVSGNPQIRGYGLLAIHHQQQQNNNLFSLTNVIVMFLSFDSIYVFEWKKGNDSM